MGKNGQGLSDLERRILRAWIANPGATHEELAAAVGVVRETVSQHMRPGQPLRARIGEILEEDLESGRDLLTATFHDSARALRSVVRRYLKAVDSDKVPPVAESDLIRAANSIVEKVSPRTEGTAPEKWIVIIGEGGIAKVTRVTGGMDLPAPETKGGPGGETIEVEFTETAPEQDTAADSD